MFLLLLKNHTRSNINANELLKEVCVVMDVIGFPLSTGFMVQELGFAVWLHCEIIV